MVTKRKKNGKQSAGTSEGPRSSALPTQMKSGEGAYKPGAGAYAQNPYRVVAGKGVARGGAQTQGVAGAGRGEGAGTGAPATAGAASAAGGTRGEGAESAGGPQVVAAATADTARPTAAGMTHAGTRAAGADGARPATAGTGHTKSATAPARVVPSGAPSSSCTHGDHPSDDDGQPGQGRPPARKRKRRWPRVVAGVVVALVLVAAGLFSWHRWLRYDDAAQMQGTWTVSGSAATVVIDGEAIWLSEDVGYSYTLDTTAKTISYTFGDMSGGGRYRFSLDRSQLVIVDGEGYWWGSTLAEDVQWMLDQALCFVMGEEPEAPVADETTTVLDWASSDTQADETSSTEG